MVRCGACRSCVACLEIEPHMALMPCGHLALCSACCVRVLADAPYPKDAKCPVCRAPVAGALRVYPA